MDINIYIYITTTCFSPGAKALEGPGLQGAPGELKSRMCFSLCVCAICVSVCLFVCVFVCLFVCVFVCLFYVLFFLQCVFSSVLCSF